MPTAEEIRSARSKEAPGTPPPEAPATPLGDNGASTDPAAAPVQAENAENSDVTQKLGAVTIGDGLSLNDLVGAIVRAMQIEQGAAQQIFKRSIEPYEPQDQKADAELMAEVIREATFAARKRGHQVGSWYKQPLDPRWPDRQAWFSPCGSCGWHVYARLDPAPNNSKKQADAERSKKVFGGKTLDVDCFQLRSRSARDEARMVASVPDDFRPQGM